MTDVTEVSCAQCRELISARVDGELSSADEAVVDDHLLGCATCPAYQEDAFALRRALRMRAVEPEADDGPAIDVAGSLQAVSFMRWTLFVIGGTLVALNSVTIVSPGGGPAEHLNRHDGVFGAALGIGMLAVAWKPHRAIGLVPLTSSIAVLMAVAAVADLMGGTATLWSEAIHIVQFAGLICLWVISGGPSRVPKHIAAVSNLVRSKDLSHDQR